MAYRLIEVTAPHDELEEAKNFIDEDHIIHSWTDRIEEGRGVLRILLPVKYSEPMMDEMADKLEYSEEFRLLIFDVQATLPRPQDDEEEKEASGTEEDKVMVTERISREELYADINDSSKLSVTYIATIILSVLVASVGLMQDNVAVIIGAMVIAPLLGPNVSLSLASTLGDLKLAWRSFKTGFAGLLLGLALSVAIGLIWEIDPELHEIASRTQVGIGDIIVALAAGTAGVLAFTRGVSEAIVGVMVAVALLPPLANLGLLLGSGLFEMAVGAAVLLTVNVICINLSGVVTFLAQGIRPRKWWEEEQAARATRIAIAVWAVLLLILVYAIVFWL